MKFQVILSCKSKKVLELSNQEFEQLIKKHLKNLRGFEVVGARSLDGVRPEVWEPARRIEKDALD